MPAWSGFWDSVHTGGHSLIGRKNAGRRLARAVRGLASKAQKELLRTLVTDDVGTAAAASHTRIAAMTPFNYPTAGGVRTVETVTDISRDVEAADETSLLLDIDYNHTPTFPVEKSGNSGGGKLGF